MKVYHGKSNYYQQVWVGVSIGKYNIELQYGRDVRFRIRVIAYQARGFKE